MIFRKKRKKPTTKSPILAIDTITCNKCKRTYKNPFKTPGKIQCEGGVSVNMSSEKIEVVCKCGKVLIIMEKT